MSVNVLNDTIGGDFILDDSETLAEYSKDESFIRPIRPHCIVRPKKMEEIKEIVNWANTTNTPIVPVSSGPPRFRGDTVPSVGGAVVVDLRRMKRILRVDRKNRVAMVEPGVTFGELIPELEKKGLAPFMPLAPRRTKSVLASSLEKEPVTVPRYHWTSQDPLLDLEVIYGSGDLLRTGSSAGPGTLEEQWRQGRAQMRGMGPGPVSFARMMQGAQGTMGIATWATVKCKLLPKVKRTFLVPADTVEELIPFMQRFFWKKLGGVCFVMNAHHLASMAVRDPEGIVDVREALPAWIFVCTIEGGGIMPEESVEYQEAEFMELAQRHGLRPTTVLHSLRGEEVSDVLSKPSPDPYWKLTFKGGCHDVFFLTTLGRTPEFIGKFCDLAAAYRYPLRDIGIYLQPTLQGTNCHCEFSLVCDPHNHREVDKIKNIDTEGSKVLASNGGFFSRPYGSWKNVAFSNAAETVIALRKMKGIFDPKGIMNPGKVCF